MFQLTEISSECGLNRHSVDVQALPFSIGRETSADFQIEGSGIWERHAAIQLGDDGRYVVSIREEATCLLNGEVIHESRALKPGDILKIGEISLRFDLSACAQKSLILQEALVYILTGTFIFSQFVCVYLFLDR
ncbi:MAG: FHA domain-containing protein [Verrucomicrobia bacterium]|jgi:hypothetical protein|nr:FHA domain-containing protein [Verrucomicrobiota bacterium]